MSRIAVTGAAGFLGRAIVAAAVADGHDVTQLTRADADLADGSGLSEVLADMDAVIHAAAGRGDDAAHARDTLTATRNLVAALPAKARLVLVSSFSVYAFDGLPDNAQLDETAPTDPDGAARDAYARAKIAQEKITLHAAQTAGLDLWIARPGAIFGPGHTTTARLGWQKSGRWLCPGGDATIPAIHVEDCAHALVQAATVPDQGWHEDVPILTGDGHVRIVNLVHATPPGQSDWLNAIGARMIRIPRAPLMRLAGILELIADAAPGIGSRIPRSLRPQTLAARFKPLRYSTHRLNARLGFAPTRPFDTAMADSLGKDA